MALPGNTFANGLQQKRQLLNETEDINITDELLSSCSATGLL